MPTSLLKRVDWGYIYPPFRDACFGLAARCQAKGVDYYAISGYRSFPEQAKLYFQGRTKPGPKVTNARPGQSAHNYGLAVDWCKDADRTKEGLQPDWDLPDYRLLADEAEDMGLEAAYYWKTFKEGPHVQVKLAGKFPGVDPGTELAHLKNLHDAGGVKKVWAYLDTLTGLVPNVP